MYVIDCTIRVVWFMIIKPRDFFLFSNIISFYISLNQIRFSISCEEILARDLLPIIPSLRRQVEKLRSLLGGKEGKKKRKGRKKENKNKYIFDITFHVRCKSSR